MSGLIMTLSDDDEPMQPMRYSDSSTAALTAEQKKAQRQQANKLSAATAAASAVPAPTKSLAQQMADAEREGDAIDVSDDEEFEMAASAKSKAKIAVAPAKKNSKAQKRKAATAELDADDDDDDAAGSFAWDADASLVPVSSSIAPPSKMFEPFVVNAGTSLQHKIEKQMAQKKKKAEANAAKTNKTAAAAAKKKGSDDESSEDDADSEGSDSDDDEDAGAGEAAADADELDSDVDMHAYKDDEVRRKVPAANGPKIITATTLPKALNPIGDFASLKLSRPLLRAVSDLGWAAPTPVQSASIMPAVAGKDLLVNAVTGVGSSRVDLQACKLEYSIVSPK